MSRRWLYVLVAAVLLVVTNGAAARGRAPAPPVVETHALVYPSTVYVTVDWNIRHYWMSPVRTSVAFVDQFTGSYMKWGNCVAGYRCIHIREVGHSGCNRPNGCLGQTFYFNAWHTFVDVSPRVRYGSVTLKKTIIAHELGHAFGIMNHNPRVTSVMFLSIPAHSGRLPYTFTASEKDILRGN